MEVSHQLHHLLHLLCLSFAVGVAYIALERFRYSKKIRDILDEGIKNAQVLLEKLNPTPDDYSFTDSAITKLKFSQANPYKYGGSFFFGLKNRKGNNKLLGTDQIFVSGSLFALYILICFCTIKTDCSSLCLFYFIFTFSILEILFISYLILLGNISIKNAQKKCEDELNDIRKTYKQPEPDITVSHSVGFLIDSSKLIGNIKQRKKKS